MQRIPSIELDKNHPLYALLKGVESKMGFMLNDGLLMAHTPEIAQAFAGLTQSILYSGTLDPGMKRLMGLVTSMATGCTYCMSHTAFSADKFEVPKEKIEAVWDYKNSDVFSEKEKAMLHVAARSGMQPNAVTDADIIRLKEHLNDAEIIELVSLLSLYAFLNRFNQTLATEVEDVPRAILESLNPE